ncbi:MAG TPA: hypothetical protein DDZ80_10260 [Cyanobacteria bacterium UBA8803]|nr:hypothetical protein [Cyanobacteria bacterium UBA9273]HBL58875.1 hypothetical protein [Cyanobacteria bacterium UBA8803]
MKISPPCPSPHFQFQLPSIGNSGELGRAIALPKSLAISFAGALWATACCGNYALAQITPDGTLGAESSTVTPNVLINGATADRINGGATRGANLFHSFSEFNINEGQRIYFASPIGIENIFSRVTGIASSDIRGTLGVEGGANLFLLNPNGVIFEENARLDVRGSFVVSTGSAIEFGNQGVFSAAEPEAPPLLTVNPSAFFFNQTTPGRIENRSIASVGVNPLGESLQGLRVPDEHSLVLVGREILVDGGGLHALGGQVELAGIATSGTVELNINDNSISVSLPEGIAPADISFTKEALINTSGVGGGEIQILGNLGLNTSETAPSISTSIDSQFHGSLMLPGGHPGTAIPTPRSPEGRVPNSRHPRPFRGLIALAQDSGKTDVVELINRNLCAVEGSEFIITGRGGLPASPYEVLDPDTLWQDWRIARGNEPTEPIVSPQVRSDRQPTTDNHPKTIVEAQGWVKDAKGNIILTAEPTTVILHRTWLTSARCQSRDFRF